MEVRSRTPKWPLSKEWNKEGFDHHKVGCYHHGNGKERTMQLLVWWRLEREEEEKGLKKHEDFYISVAIYIKMEGGKALCWGSCVILWSTHAMETIANLIFPHARFSLYCTGVPRHVSTGKRQREERDGQRRIFFEGKACCPKAVGLFLGVKFFI